jgi:hypothetical protein
MWQSLARVIAGLSRPKDGVASLAYDPAIHDESPRKQIARFSALQFNVDARVKPAA